MRAHMLNAGVLPTKMWHIQAAAAGVRVYKVLLSFFVPPSTQLPITDVTFAPLPFSPAFNHRCATHKGAQSWASALPTVLELLTPHQRQLRHQAHSLMLQGSVLNPIQE